jgi:hypothetical protein
MAELETTKNTSIAADKKFVFYHDVSVLKEAHFQ